MCAIYICLYLGEVVRAGELCGWHGNAGVHGAEDGRHAMLVDKVNGVSHGHKLVPFSVLQDQLQSHVREKSRVCVDCVD